MSGSAILQLPSPMLAVGSTHCTTQTTHALAEQDQRNAPGKAQHTLQPSGVVDSLRAVSLPVLCGSASTNVNNAYQDLDHYIALGCLLIHDSLPKSRGPLLEGIWGELLSLPDETKLIIGEQAANLLNARWIRLFLLQSDRDSNSLHSVVRVYLLPEDWNRRFVDRNSQDLKTALHQLLPLVDTSPNTWAGNHQEGNAHYFDPWASSESVSLYYLFNKLPSPAPDPANIKNRYARAAVRDLLRSAAPSEWEEHGEQPLVGLRTRLYPYQARSASLMVQREAAPQRQLDPRLEVRTSPNGRLFYFGARDGTALLEPRYYESARGGILAETMGLGKTLCCLAVILTTKGQCPQIPAAYMPPPPVRERVGSLSDMAASIIGRRSVSAKALVEQSEVTNDTNYAFLKDALDRNIPFYEIPHHLPRSKRSTKILRPRQLVICPGTIIVVPRNLLHQWQSEIQKHVLPEGLKILVVDTLPTRGKAKHMQQDTDTMRFVSDLPSPTELMRFDVVLFTRNRFEQETMDGTDNRGRQPTAGVARVCRCPYIGSTSIRDCNCVATGSVYESPLKKLHWLRIIIDEGHSFSNSISNAVKVAKELHVERRWIVSGTPAKNLVGVELDMETLASDTADVTALRESAIEQRKTFGINDFNKEKTAVQALGSLASHYLMVPPWYVSTAEGKRPDWEDYVYRHEKRHTKTYSGFSSCFLRILEGLVVKTRPEDVEKDVILPPMTHRVVYLKPCWYDKMTANLFVQVLRANAITSERSDVDYLFHKNSTKARHSLIRNLRQSNFTWTGFRLEDILSTLETTEKYLFKDDKNSSPEDVASLVESSQNISRLVTSKEWTALSKAHEVGMAVENWPKESEEAFALAYPAKPTMVGITQLLHGQSHVDSNIMTQDPTQGLAAVGQVTKARIDAIAEAEEEKKETAKKDSSGSQMMKSGVPSSCLGSQLPPTSRRVSAMTGNLKDEKSEDTPALSKTISPLPPRKRKLTLTEELADLATDSPLRNTHVIATTSAKLTYLLDKVVEHQATEKIIIFYDGDNAAFYISQCLDMLFINHRIYARTLNNVDRSKYVALFNEDPDVRVLLIDVACGALGLNLNAASVVLIINPINRPDIEAQAIKRAHRIGQNKKVTIETLVLENTIEHAIFDHAKKMSRAQHLEAKELEDDEGIIDIIQNAQILPTVPEEEEGVGMFASLRTPQQVFGRPDRHKYHGNIDSKLHVESRKKSKPTTKGKSTTKKDIAKLSNAHGLVDTDMNFLLAHRSGTSTPVLGSQIRGTDSPQPTNSLFGAGRGL